MGGWYPILPKILGPFLTYHTNSVLNLKEPVGSLQSYSKILMKLYSWKMIALNEPDLIRLKDKLITPQIKTN